MAGEPTFCHYDFFDPNNGKKFGRLYNFHAIHDPRGLSPENFSIPTFDDFSQLIDFLEKEKNEVGFKDWCQNQDEHKAHLQAFFQQLFSEVVEERN